MTAFVLFVFFHNDALTTYLVWLRVAHFGGHFTGEEYEVEQQLVRELILSEIKNGKIHLKGNPTRPLIAYWLISAPSYLTVLSRLRLRLQTLDPAELPYIKAN